MIFCHTLEGKKLECFNVALMLIMFRIFISLVTYMLIAGLTKYSRASPQPLFLTDFYFFVFFFRFVSPSIILQFK